VSLLVGDLSEIIFTAAIVVFVICAAVAVFVGICALIVSDEPTAPRPGRAPQPPGDGDWGEPLPPEGEGT
jgi:hypothetical protein